MYKFLTNEERTTHPQCRLYGKIAPEAIKKQHTMSELAQKYQLHPKQVTLWKKEFLRKAETVFDRATCGI